MQLRPTKGSFPLHGQLWHMARGQAQSGTPALIQLLHQVKQHVHAGNSNLPALAAKTSSQVSPPMRSRRCAAKTAMVPCSPIGRRPAASFRFGSPVVALPRGETSRARPARLGRTRGLPRSEQLAGEQNMPKGFYSVGIECLQRTAAGNTRAEPARRRRLPPRVPF